MSIFKLQSSDGKIFEVDKELVLKFTVLKDIFESLEIEEVDEEPIMMDYINSAILEKLIEWITHHREDPEDPPPPVDDNELHDRHDLSKWDKELLNVDLYTLKLLWQAANFLHVKGLMDVLGKYFAQMIIGKSPEEMREVFCIKNDFTPEMEDKVREENMWGVEEKLIPTS